MKDFGENQPDWKSWYPDGLHEVPHFPKYNEETGKKVVVTWKECPNYQHFENTHQHWWGSDKNPHTSTMAKIV